LKYSAESVPKLLGGRELIYDQDLPVSEPKGFGPINTSVESLPDNLPVAEKWQLIEAVRQLTDQQARDVLQSRLLPIVFMPGEILYAAAGSVGFATARERQVRVVARAAPDDLLQALQLVLGKQILHNSRFHLANDTPVYSASRRLTTGQVVFFAIAVMMVIAGFWFAPEITIFAGSAFFAVTFLAVVGLRLASYFPRVERSSPPRTSLSDEQLPIYTILVPLFRETLVINQLLRGLLALNYPVAKLDIKLILEEKDQDTRRAIAQIALPPQFEVIVVPHAKPQTKPKALNYALHFARGDLAVIYDAEDVAEPDQLRIAAETFAAGPRELVCLQARLTYYNANENWLTRQFTIEYSVLFDVFLPMLASFRLPLPLGGTSNHFKMRQLRALGAWDPFNVTEDADLGIRLARFGWYADVIASSTFEEANTQFGNWLAQRARWLKGWIQTWFVHMRNPVLLARQMGFAGFLVFQVLMAGIVISTLVHPLFLIVMLAAVVTGSFNPLEQTSTDTVLIGIGIAVFVAGYCVTMIAGYIALGLRGLAILRLSVLAMPIYWIMMSIGGWLAVKQFITDPFHWNKTRHGLSRVNSRQRK